MMRNYSVPVKESGSKNVKYVSKGGQGTGLIIDSKQKFMVNTGLCNSQPAGVNTNISLMFSLAPCSTESDYY